MTAKTKEAVKRPEVASAESKLPASIPTAPKGEVPREVEVQSKLIAVQSDMIKKLGSEIIQSMGKVVEKYWELITYIRRNGVGPKIVSFELTRLGFKRSRISEVNRISQAKDDVFKQYEAKLIGFDRALELARKGEKGGVEATPAAKLLTDGGSLDAGDVAEAIKDEASPSKGSKGDGKTAADHINSALSTIAKYATRSGVRNVDGWCIRWTKLPKVDGPTNADLAKEEMEKVTKEYDLK